jgi:hypothetical protein
MIKGFIIGFLTGVAFIAFRLFKYGAGGSRSELPIYVAVLLSFGIAGAILVSVVRLIRERLRKKE